MAPTLRWVRRLGLLAAVGAALTLLREGMLTINTRRAARTQDKADTIP
jgi:hypothetical protein